MRKATRPPLRLRVRYDTDGLQQQNSPAKAKKRPGAAGETILTMSDGDSELSERLLGGSGVVGMYIER